MKQKTLSSFFAAAALFCSSASFAASGGPDSYGYRWKDSNEPGGPAYNWIEIATPAGGSGTYRNGVNCDDCHEANIPLGFNFPYYGVNMSNIAIGSNGTVYFEDVYLGLSNSCIPGTPSYSMSQYRFIAHLWDDLAPNYQGGVYTQAFPNYFVIEFYDIVPCCSPGDGDTWQVILFSNGNILMQYKELSYQGLFNSFTVGIQNSPSVGLQYKCDAAGYPLASGRAILFSPPTVNCNNSVSLFPPTTPLCSGGSVVLSAGATSIAQTWSNAATTPTITVNAAGNFHVAALDVTGCTIRDTTSVVVFASPVANLGPDATACGSVTLNPNVANMNYLWSDNSTNATLTVSTSGTYSVVVTDPASGCSDDDQIVVTINPLPVNSLGMDITQCGGPVTLNAGNPGLNYQWNDNSTAQTLNVNASGTYYVTVTNAMTMCSNSDTIMVTINANPVVDLGADTTACGSLVLDAGNAGMDYLWSDASTSQTLSALMSGVYSVEVTDPATGCATNDTISLTLNSTPVVNLGGDQTHCGSLLLDAGNPGMDYLWSDNSTMQTLNVTSTGSYAVEVTDITTGCSGWDSAMITINTALVVDLGGDTMFCGTSFVLDAGNQGASFLWSDNSTSQTLTVSSNGTYYVTVTDPNTGCMGTDTIMATLNALPTVTFSLPPVSPCEDDASLTLSGGAPAGGVYSGPGVTAGSFDPSVGAGTHTITYTYTDANGCPNSATQAITVDACTGIREYAASPISVYPNPSTGVLTIESNSSANIVTVFNTIGETVMAQQMNTSRLVLDLSAQTNGIYFVQVTNANGTYFEKVVLQK